MFLDLSGQIPEPCSLVEKLLDDDTVVERKVGMRRKQPFPGHGIPPVTVPASDILAVITLTDAYVGLIASSPVLRLLLICHFRYRKTIEKLSKNVLTKQKEESNMTL